MVLQVWYSTRQNFVASLVVLVAGLLAVQNASRVGSGLVGMSLVYSMDIVTSMNVSRRLSHVPVCTNATTFIRVALLLLVAVLDHVHGRDQHELD